MERVRVTSADIENLHNRIKDKYVKLENVLADIDLIYTDLEKFTSFGGDIIIEELIKAYRSEKEKLCYVLEIIKHTSDYFMQSYNWLHELEMNPDINALASSFE